MWVLSDAEAREQLRHYLAARQATLPTNRGIYVVAGEMGVSAAYVYEALRGRREIGPKIARAIGLQKVVGYLPVSAPAPDSADGSGSVAP
jgi:hypothetical protein